MAIADILVILVAHEVDFVVVGGMAAILQGAPVSTFDLDVVYARSVPNIDRLLLALSELQAVFRDDPRRLRPDRSHLESAGHKLLETPHGALDLLGTIEQNTGFDDLVAESEWLDLGDIRIRVLTIPRLIRSKEYLKRPKDQAAIVILRATLEERNKEPQG